MSDYITVEANGTSDVLNEDMAINLCSAIASAFGWQGAFFTNDSNPDWQHIRAQVEQTLDWFVTWDAADQSLGYSPMEDAELIIALGSALTALAEHNGITTHIYGKS